MNDIVRKIQGNLVERKIRELDFLGEHGVAVAVLADSFNGFLLRLYIGASANRCAGAAWWQNLGTIYCNKTYDRS